MVGVFVMIIILPFCFGGCTIFSNGGWPNGQAPEYQRPAGDKTDIDPGTPPEHEDPPQYDYYDEEYYEGYGDVYSGLVTAYLPSVRDEGTATQEYLQARAKFNIKVAQQYAVLSEYVIYSLLGKYGGGAVDVDLTFDVGKAGVTPVVTAVQGEPIVNTGTLFSTLGAIERSVDAVRLEPETPSTIEISNTAEIVPNLNSANAWLCNLGIGVGDLGADYNANYVAKYKEFLQIRLMEEVIGVSTKTTLSVYNTYTAQVRSMAISRLAKQVPSLGLIADSVLVSKVQSIIRDEVIGSVALARSTQDIAVQEKFVWTVEGNLVPFIRELDINANTIIEDEVYYSNSIYGYAYAEDVSSVVSGLLQWWDIMPKADSREYISIDVEEYYSPMQQPDEGQKPDITHMQYQDYTSAILYNKAFAFPWLLGVSIQSKENLVIDVYIRVRKTFVDNQTRQTVTQVLQLGTMHTDSTKDFNWDGGMDPHDDTVDYDNLVANNQMWNVCLEFLYLLPEVTMDDMLPNSDAYVDDEGNLQYSVTDIDFSKDKFKDYRYIYYMQTLGLTPGVEGSQIPTEVVPGSDTNSQVQGYYQGDYDAYLSTNKLVGTASDNREVTFSQNLVVYNDQNNQNDYFEVIFDVRNKNEVTDSTFKFYLEQCPLTENDEEE